MFPVEVEYLNTSKKVKARGKNRDDKETCYMGKDNDQMGLTRQLHANDGTLQHEIQLCHLIWWHITKCLQQYIVTS